MMEPPPDITNCLPARLITDVSRCWPPDDVAARHTLFFAYKTQSVVGHPMTLPPDIMTVVLAFVVIAIAIKQKCNYTKLFVAAR
jgi:hypothetical protein